MRFVRLFLLLLLPVLIVSCEDDSVSSQNPAQKSILSIVPDSAYARDTVSILGSGFGSSIENIKVKFGEKDVEILSVSDSVIQLVCPLQKVSETDVSVSFDGEDVENNLVFYPKWYYFIMPVRCDLEVSVRNISLIYQRTYMWRNNHADSVVVDTVFSKSDYLVCRLTNSLSYNSLESFFSYLSHAEVHYDGYYKFDSLNQILEDFDVSDFHRCGEFSRWNFGVSAQDMPFTIYDNQSYGVKFKGQGQVAKWIKIQKYFDEELDYNGAEAPYRCKSRTIGSIFNDSSQVSIMFSD